MPNQANILQNDIGRAIYLVDALGNPLAGGAGCIGTTGIISAATGTNTYPLSLFNPATSAKTILIYSLIISCGTAATGGLTAYLQATTTDPAYVTKASVTNGRFGGGASSASCTFTNVSQALAGSYVDVQSSSSLIELLPKGATILLPAGAANGITAFAQSYAAGFVSLSAHWIEF